MALEFQNNPSPSLLMVEAVDETDPSPDALPSVGQRRLIVGPDHLLYLLDESGVATAVGGAGGLSDPMTTRGDIIIRNASNVTARLGRGSASQVLTSDGTDIAWATPSAGAQGTELDYVQVTSDTNVTATSEATANTIVTGSAVAYNGSTAVWIEFWCDHAGPTATGGTNDIRFWLYDGSSSIGFIAYSQQDQASGQRQYLPIIGKRRITPSNATHTYSIRASVSAATGLVAAGAGGSGNIAPAYIRITRV
jgi:hypothetical protein